MIEHITKPSKIPPGFIKNIPLESAGLRKQEKRRWNQPSWPGRHKVPAIHDAVAHRHGANLGGHTYAEEEDVPGTVPSRAPEADRESRGEDMWGCWPGARDL